MPSHHGNTSGSILACTVNILPSVAFIIITAVLAIALFVMTILYVVLKRKIERGEAAIREVEAAGREETAREGEEYVQGEQRGETGLVGETFVSERDLEGRC